MTKSRAQVAAEKKAADAEAVPVVDEGQPVEPEVEEPDAPEVEDAPVEEAPFDPTAALAELDEPTDPLPGVPVEAEEGIHAPLGEPQPREEAPTDEVGVDPVVARGPLEPTPAETVVHSVSTGRPEDGVPPIKDGA